MSAAPAPASGARRNAAPLFLHEVRRDGRPIVVLRGVRQGKGVVVEADVYPLVEKPVLEPLQRPFPFSSAAHASRFVEEALTALEYLGCVVFDPSGAVE